MGSAKGHIYIYLCVSFTAPVVTSAMGHSPFGGDVPFLFVIRDLFILQVKQCHLHHPRVISVFKGGMVSIPGHG